MPEEAAMSAVVDTVFGTVSAGAEAASAASAAYGTGVATGVAAAGTAAAGTAAAGTAAAGMSFSNMAMLTAGSQVLGSLLAPTPAKVGSMGVLNTAAKTVTPMPGTPTPLTRARKEQDILRNSGMGRAQTDLTDALG